MTPPKLTRPQALRLAIAALESRRQFFAFDRHHSPKIAREYEQHQQAIALFTEELAQCQPSRNKPTP